MNSLINGINMAWDDSGSGPAVCLIHGFPLNRCMWSSQAKALAIAGYRVITPDLRGFGESDAPDCAYSMDLFADDLVALLDHLDVETAVIGGMSMGGYVLLNLLERYPERVSAACFIVTRSGADDEAGKERRLNLAHDVMKSGPHPVAEIFGNVLFAERSELESPKIVEVVRGWMMSGNPRGLAGGLLAMAERKDYTPLLAGFRLPSLVIGAEKDKAITMAQIRILALGLPNHQLCIIPDAGHLANLEQPAAFNSCLLDFLGGLTLD